MEQVKLSYKVAPTDFGNSNDGWREIVKQRVESKTRRFRKGATKEVVATNNRFGLVAGCFFYPLMANFDRCVQTSIFFIYLQINFEVLLRTDLTLTQFM